MKNKTVVITGAGSGIGRALGLEFGMTGVANCSDYCASKFAVRSYTESLASEFQNSPINIHCVSTDGINTRIKRNGNSPDYIRKYLRTPAQGIAKHIIKSIQKNQYKHI